MRTKNILTAIMIAVATGMFIYYGTFENTNYLITWGLTCMFLIAGHMIGQLNEIIDLLSEEEDDENEDDGDEPI